MNRDQLLALFDHQVRFAAEEAPYARHALPPDAPRIVRCVPRDPAARWGWVIWSRLDDATADEAIRQQVAYFTERGQNFEWKRFHHDAPADLDARLLRHGFVAEESETVLVYDLSRRLEPAQAKACATIELRKLTDPADLAQVIAVEDKVWGTPHDWIGTELAAELTLPGEPTVIYLAYADGVPAAAAWMRFYQDTDFAALFGGSTLPEYRQRGLYTALLAVRAEEALRRGYRYLTVDASEMSRPILEKHGFIPITKATAYKYYVAP